MKGLTKIDYHFFLGYHRVPSIIRTIARKNLLISVVLRGMDPGHPDPRVPLLHQSNALALSFSAEEIID